jgi:YhcH/YjgK/YiaL family protein
MILDRLEHISRYAALGPAYRKAFDYLAATNLDALKDGRYPIDGENVYAIASSYETSPAESRKLEAHRTYADIQVLLAGEETIQWTPLEGLPVLEDYQADKDIILLADRPGPAGLVPVHLTPGLFAVFFAWDAHKPGCSLRQPQKVRKLVIKVRL